ncbi:hypothetical protein [Pseudarthrobacter cellobiosi]|uniref:hypothetical protein n=1 Tax=Pseudarthrobacter cellobiosi TaxID=2953654 RepID=UPI00208F54D2|nr:hypothetical protein [Pseudarthrobacter sp. HLT1-5]MCO4256478.1 hypothetical protein [Pseudarthrobacter sp. HLT1-5]
MARVGTAAYLALMDAVDKAAPVIGHESLISKFDPPAVAPMVRDLFAVLSDLLHDERIRSADNSLYQGATSGELVGWFDGRGATQTLEYLEIILGSAYEQEKLNARILSSFRKSLTMLVTQTLRHSAAGNGPGPAEPLREALQRLEDLERDEATRLLDDIRSQQEKATASATAAAKAAGITGDATMSSYYESLAETERDSADNFRRLTVTMVFAAAAVTALFIMGPTWGWGWFDIAAGDYVHLLQRAILLAGIFALAGYFARQAHQHRSLANWAGSLAVQLKTFDAFLAPIGNQDVRDDLRKTFGARVFGDHPAMKGEPSVAPTAAAMDTAVGWAAKLTAGGSK